MKQFLHLCLSFAAIGTAFGSEVCYIETHCGNENAIRRELLRTNSLQEAIPETTRSTESAYYEIRAQNKTTEVTEGVEQTENTSDSQGTPTYIPITQINSTNSSQELTRETIESTEVSYYLTRTLETTTESTEDVEQIKNTNDLQGTPTDVPITQINTVNCSQEPAQEATESTETVYYGIRVHDSIPESTEGIEETANTNNLQETATYVSITLIDRVNSSELETTESTEKAYYGIRVKDTTTDSTESVKQTESTSNLQETATDIPITQTNNVNSLQESELEATESTEKAYYRIVVQNITTDWTDSVEKTEITSDLQETPTDIPITETNRLNSLQEPALETTKSTEKAYYGILLQDTTTDSAESVDQTESTRDLQGTPTDMPITQINSVNSLQEPAQETAESTENVYYGTRVPDTTTACTEGVEKTENTSDSQKTSTDTPINLTNSTNSSQVQPMVHYEEPVSPVTSAANSTKISSTRPSGSSSSKYYALYVLLVSLISGIIIVLISRTIYKYKTKSYNLSTASRGDYELAGNGEHK